MNESQGRHTARITIDTNGAEGREGCATKAKEQASLILAETKKLQIFVMNIGHGDWFVLYQMSKNLDHKFFVDFIVRLSTKINNRRFHGKFDCAILYYFKMQRIILSCKSGQYLQFFFLFI